MKKNHKALLQLKKAMEEKLPEGADVFGYLGITRAILISGLEESLGLVEEIEGREDTFDIIVFKREVEELRKHCGEYLESLPREEQDKDFNKFLMDLASIRRLVNSTYLLSVKQVLRPESELAAIKSALEEIAPKNQELSQSHEQSAAWVKEIKDWHAQCSTFHSGASAESQQVTALVASVQTQVKEIQAQHQNTATWSTAIEAAKTDIAQQKAAMAENQVKLVAQAEDLKTKSAAFAELKSLLDAQVKRNAEFQEEIRKTIGDANRSSMAGSFKTRKDELEKPLLNAERTLAFVLLLFLAASLYMYWPYANGATFQIKDLWPKLPILTPLIWLAWFYTSKTGHLTRIKEDYSFKYAAAMAFEGYNKNCEENDELAHQLLKLSVENMGANPIRLYGKGGVPSGPIPELLEKGGQIIGKVAAAMKPGKS